MTTERFLFDEMAGIIKELGGYTFSLELGGKLRIDVTLDLRGGRQHVLISRTDEPAKAEVFWEHGTGYGRKLPNRKWQKVDGSPFPDYASQILEMLKGAEPAANGRDEDVQTFSLPIERTPLQQDPAAFFSGILGAYSGPASERMIAALSVAASGIRQEMHARIDRRRKRLLSLRSTVQLRDRIAEALLTFEFAPADVPALPEAALEASGPAVPMSLFLMNLPQWGWSAYVTHGPWAQAAIDLVEAADSEGKYESVYDAVWSGAKYDDGAARSGSLVPAKHHPIVVGAVHEDSGDLPASPYKDWFISDQAYQSNPKHYAETPYLRDFHHFGGGGLGLQHKWYFFLRAVEDGDVPATTMPGGRFYSARDWGFGGGRIDPKLSRLTFCDAIEQFNQNSFDGRRRAYLMLGHVLHLLQDQGMPDHARLVDHAGSSKAEIDVFKYFCPLIALEIALLACAACGPFCLACSLGAFGIAEGVCMGLVEADEVGYEKLTADNPPKIGAVKILNVHDYDKFFGNIAAESDNATSLKSALGCSGLTVPPFPTIPNINPDINAKDAGETKPFFQLTEKLLPKIVGYGAGLIQHFHDIVNPPPFVQRLAIVQWQPGDKPREFAFFAKDKDHCNRYDAAWQQLGSGRTLTVTMNQQVDTDRPIYFFVQFGPAEVAPDTGRRMSKAMLRVQGQNLFTGQPIDEEVKLYEARDSKTGYYYWGGYQPFNCVSDPNTLNIRIEGTDTGAHLAIRQAPGNVPNADPAKIPYVDSSSSPDFPWKDYQAGPDLHHKFTIGKLVWKGFSAEPGALSVGREGFIKLHIDQIRHDCKWEEHPGPVTCPVTWKVETALQKVELKKDGLSIKPDRDVCGSGQYSIKITCTLGTYSQTKIVQVTVL